ncbi:hypothetical protein B0H17DRAFT_1160422 [Mycena rosella]|uniref:DUF6589 domain-containing protein n=1 Tax=Mycena rosella TaxID=1033263 RepID=A0AAD7DC21_MYCRO|nr:hypothetical protein B0H17DRAFT_1160422 [Mycena rosella]
MADPLLQMDLITPQMFYDFRSLGHFLEVVFYNHISGVPDLRTTRHVRVVTAFLGGETNVTMATIIDLIYNHRQSRAPKDSPEDAMNFSPPDVASPRDITSARQSLSTWALQLVGQELRRKNGELTQNDPTDPADITQLRAATNGRANNVRLATWDIFGQLSIPRIASTYKRRAPAVWYATECMGAPTVNGAVVVRKRRPHTTVQVGVISALTLSRNRYATGYLALPLAVWQFACKTHVTEKRIFSRFGFTVHDTTARACLDSLTHSSMAKLRASVAEGIKNGTMYWQLVLDNVQEYWREDILKVGTAATAILLEDCAPGAFNLQDHIDRVMLQERRQMTIDSLHASIDWQYIHNLTVLHWVRILVYFIPELAYLRSLVNAEFNSARMSKRRLPKERVTVMQPVGTNGEHSTETQGMLRALLNFLEQMGLDEEAMKNLIFMPRGDGASIAAIWRIKKFLAAHPEHYKAFRNIVPPGPEIWHTRWTQLNTIASNTYGPASSTDPSSLSKSATAAGAKRPSNLKKVDFFPTSRSMILFFEARVLDCWRISFGVGDLIEHFAKPMSNPPDLQLLWGMARKLKAYTQAVNKDFFDSARPDMKVPLGTPWVAPAAGSGAANDDEEGAEEEDIDAVALDDAGEDQEGLSELEEDGRKRKKKKTSAIHVEEDGFEGDRVIANEALFLQDMGWWIIAHHAVPEGEIGAVWEILKIWIFSFSGSTNRNYANYLLETYCLHRYEASKDFSDAMLNNWLIRPRRKAKYIECDWVQEDYNKWLEELVEHKGGDFNDHFYRHTLAPNVMEFLRMKENMESAFGLKPRGKTHGAPHLRNEFQQLLRMHKEDQLHLYRPGRTMGHASLNYYALGYEKLDDTRIAKFIEESTAYSDITKDRRVDEVVKDHDAVNSDEEPEIEPEIEDGEDGDDAGDGTMHGIDYSDQESERSDDEDIDRQEEDEPEEDMEGHNENEEQSEVEEEQMDQYVPPVDDTGFESDD